MDVMQNSIHSKFILTPIIGILKDTVNACAGIGNGIETQSLGEYVLQTTFLKMTGASEQKQKCICWEMATNDYDYRYKYLKKNYGECSSYADKCSIYKDIKDRICKIDVTFDVNRLFGDIDITTPKKEYINRRIEEERKIQEAKKKAPLDEEDVKKIKEQIKNQYDTKGFSNKEIASLCREVLFESISVVVDGIIGNTLLAQWEPRCFQDYLSLWNELSHYDYVKGDALLGKELQDLYNEIVYSHRNRCAHNLVSFQNNLPTLKTLEDEKFVYHSYYFRFSILILLDEIFVRLYKAYQEALEKVI